MVEFSCLYHHVTTQVLGTAKPLSHHFLSHIPTVFYSQNSFVIVSSEKLKFVVGKRFGPPRLGERQNDWPPWHSIHSTKHPGLFVCTQFNPLCSPHTGTTRPTPPGSAATQACCLKVGARIPVSDSNLWRHVTPFTVGITPTVRNRPWVYG